jgi:hypothetical protein
MEYSFAARRSRAFSVLAATIAATAALVPMSATKSAPNTQAEGEIVTTGTMETRRSGHTATPLRNGDVLITGGMVRNGEFVAEAELYDLRLVGSLLPAEWRHPVSATQPLCSRMAGC